MDEASMTHGWRGRLKAVRLASTSWLADHPGGVSTALTALVAVHAVLASVFLSVIDPYKNLAFEPNTSTAVTIYLGLAAAAAIVAGFAGVIIVFTIGSEARRIRLFRFNAGEALQRSWIAAVAEPLLATLLGLLAAVTQVTSGKVLAPWLFELGVVLFSHGALRQLWLLWHLIEIVHADDHVAEEADNEVAAEALFPKLPGK